jgi:hypothetical protein
MNHVIQNAFILEYYPIEEMDSGIIEMIMTSKSFKSSRNLFLKRILNAYLTITEQTLSFIELSSPKFRNIADDLYLLLSPQYINLSNDTLNRARRGFKIWVNEIKHSIPNLKDYEINQAQTDFNFHFNQDKINYLNGWFLKSRCNKKSMFINLIMLYKVFGKENTNLIYNNAQRYTSKFDLDTSKSFLAMLNEFSNFLSTKNLQEIQNNIYKEEYLLGTIKEFCFDFFQNEQSNSRCMHNSKKKWNKFVNVFTEIFLDGNILPKLSGTLPKAPNHEKRGFEKRVKIKNGNQVKTKLITDIPLNITDDIAMEILFKKINADVQVTLNWADSKIKLLKNNYNPKIASSCFNKNIREIQKELKNTKTISDLKANLICSHDLEPFMFLLISECPQITESYLLNFELYDENNHLTGYIKTDESGYLVGYKKRRGANLAEQKILLNKKTKEIVEDILYLTKEYRECLKSEGNDDWRYLFLHGGSNGNIPQRFKKSYVPAPSNLKNTEGQNRIDYIVNETKSSRDDVEFFVTNMTMTKLRASIAVQLYLVQNDTQKMAEALGHKKYKPELLSFYLPETILEFFQSRWIRIFQKGIICEAMKNSENLFRASSFNSLEELEEFMELHSLKNIPNIKKQDTEVENKDEIYIGVNEEILRVLISLEKAVELAKEEVSAKALFWAKFSSKIQNEIAENKTNIHFLKDLEKAKNNINIEMFNQVIYAK